MLTLWTAPSVFSAVSVVLACVPIFIMLFASGRGFGESILCMDCQQCVAVCPVRKAKGMDYMGPHGIMKTARVDHKKRAEEGGLYSCTSCMSCAVACPRGLNTEETMVGFRNSLAKSGLGQLAGHRRIINRVDKYGNPYSEKMAIPDVDSQADEIKKQMAGYAKRIGLDLKVFEEKKETEKKETETAS